MAEFRYKISVVIPVYNCGEFLNDCVKSLNGQTMHRKDFQIIFVNDGSTDDSADICKALAADNKNIVYFEKENGGVSSARNKGIELSEGKYILYLDADDTLTKDTLKSIYKFFESHYDETDLVTYKIVPYRNGKPGKVHYRYGILKQSGVYDLNDGKNCHIAQSTMNICVKNLKEKNVLFDTTLKIHEDQKYCYTILREKMTIGYCSGPEYHYLRRSGSAMGKIKAYYIFEDTMNMWESFFNEYDDCVPRYLQAFFLHDINWKGASDILLPYHYDGENFENAKNSLLRLIDRIDDDVILTRPSMDIYHKHFLLRLKGSKSVSYEPEDGKMRLMFDGEPVYRSERVTAAITHLRVDDGILKMDAFLKSPVFLYCKKPELWFVTENRREKLELTHSQQEYYHAYIRNAVFWRFKLNIDISEVREFHLEIVIDGVPYKTNFYNMPNSPFVHGKKYKSFFRCGYFIREKRGNFKIVKYASLSGKLTAFNTFLRNFIFYTDLNPRVLYNRLIGLKALKKNEKSWIYLDRYGVFDNAYYQFKHDFQKSDGINRYYILSESDVESIPEYFTPEERKNIVLFHSTRHKELYFSCDRLITSFSNLSNVCPFGGAAMRWYADLTRFELIYLQHGILHAWLPKMYGKEFSVVDRVVVSSEFEVKNFTENYSYDDKDLIKSCMPRYDFIKNGGLKKNRILFSPSWRSNLIGGLVNNERVALPEVFVNSEFYKQVSAFLNSQKLHDLLEKNDLYLDFQNHPIFKCYNDLFEITNDRVSTDNSETAQDEYKLMITDYSSIVFDSVYLNCPVIYFVPDYDLFLSGVSHTYRKLDLPLEEGFGPFAHNADELVDFLEQYVNNNFKPQQPYASRMDNFFLYKDEHCRDRLYEGIR